MSKFEKARLKYKPEKIKYLLVAETPPKSDSDRFFYFENVSKQDSLFLETMKVLYPTETNGLETKTIRSIKNKFLTQFAKDGFYLIDSLETPFEEKLTSSNKIKLINGGQLDLLKRIQSIVDKKTKIILISATVFKANFQFLIDQKVNVINTELLDFPGSGGQVKYRNKMTNLLKK